MTGVGLRRCSYSVSRWALLSACAAAPPASTGAPGSAAPGRARESGRRDPAGATDGACVARCRARPVEPLPEAFESDDFVVVLAKAGDTAESLARRYLGDPAKAWMVEDYNGTATFTPGREVVIPKRPWNPAGVEPRGYQLVPILCYHNLGPQTRGRLLMSASAFEEQMRYLKREGYHVITLKQFLEFASLRQQLPRKTVVLTFDDGWKSFKEYAYPILKELGYPATLFIYTDFIGARHRPARGRSSRSSPRTASTSRRTRRRTTTCAGSRRSPKRTTIGACRPSSCSRSRIFQQRVGQPAEDPRVSLRLPRRGRGQARPRGGVHRRPRRAAAGEPLVHADAHDPSGADLFRDDPR